MRRWLVNWFSRKKAVIGDADFFERIAAIRKLQQSGHAFDFEDMLEQHYRRFLQRGNVVIDVGAHVGRHLSRFVECVGTSGRVIAFEPLPFAFEELRSRFKQSNVELENCALTDHTGSVSFVHAQGTPEESGLRQRVYNQPDVAKPIEITVRADILDNFNDRIPRLDYIKIDVEGGEMNVLYGSKKIIATHRPYISVEYGRPGYSVYGHSLFTVFDFSEAIDYVMYDIFGHRLDRLRWPMSCDSICWDFFMVPQEKASDFEGVIEAIRVDGI
jgi:FkbM family methyltransferase